MLINWFTVGAQVVNFIILVFLLKRFLYGPIISIMEQRESAINQRLEEAKAVELSAQEEKKNYQDLKREFEEDKTDMLQAAEQEVQKWRHELREKARQEITEMQKQWQESLEREGKSFLRHFKTKAGEEILGVLRRILKDIANRDLETEVVQTFVERLLQLDQDEKEKIVAALEGVPEEGKVQIFTALTMSPEMQQELAKTIAEQLGSSRDVEFSEQRELILGIELRAAGYKLAWNIDSYLEGLISELTNVLTHEQESKLVKEEMDG